MQILFCSFSTIRNDWIDNDNDKQGSKRLAIERPPKPRI